MKEFKLVAESLNEHINNTSNEKLNEKMNILKGGAEKSLETFLKKPENNEKSFLSGYSAQMNRRGGDTLKKIAGNLSIELKKKYAQQSLDKLEKDPGGYPWLVIKDGKIVAGSAMKTKGKKIGTNS